MVSVGRVSITTRLLPTVYSETEDRNGLIPMQGNRALGRTKIAMD